MVKPILTYPKDKDILTKVSEEANWEECKELIQDLKDTLHTTQDGIGISAIQIGVPKRVCIVTYNGQEIAMINPKIVRTRGEQMSHEGCLSAPNIYGDFKRANKVWCEYTDENGRAKEIEGSGLISREIQHELDHFDGWCVVFDLVKE